MQMGMVGGQVNHHDMRLCMSVIAMLLPCLLSCLLSALLSDV